MKKILFIIFCFSFALTVSAQKLSKKEAKQMLDKTLTCLKNNDTTTFINLWYVDNAVWPYHERPFQTEDVKDHFEGLREFLDTALAQDFKIETIEIEKQNKNDTNYCAQYKIMAGFRYTRFYGKGIAFNVDLINGKWLYRFEPDYSTISSKSKVHL